MTRSLTCAVCALVLALGLQVPSAAWIYDTGIANHAGPVIQQGTNLEWAAAQFVLAVDSWATEFGITLGRSFGPADTGFNVYFSPSLQDPAGLALASWTVIPTSPIADYYYVRPQAPIYLRANQPYYIAITPNSSNFAGMTSYCLNGYRGWGSSDAGLNWFQLAYPVCVRVDGSAVPEPASALACAAGLIGLLGRRQRR